MFRRKPRRLQENTEHVNDSQLRGSKNQTSLLLSEEATLTELAAVRRDDITVRSVFYVRVVPSGLASAVGPRTLRA